MCRLPPVGASHSSQWLATPQDEPAVPKFRAALLDVVPLVPELGFTTLAFAFVAAHVVSPCAMLTAA
jgi:hypothetical protein